MTKSLLRRIVKERAAETVRATFIEKICNESGLPKETIAEAFDSGNSLIESKANVFLTVESHRWVNPDIKDSRQTRRNPVARNMNKFNHPSVVPDKRREMRRGEVKHKKAFEDNANRKEVSQIRKQANILANNLRRNGRDSGFAMTHAKKLEKDGRSQIAAVWYMAARFVSHYGQERRVREGADNKEHRVFDYKKKQYVGKPMSQKGAYNSANKRNMEYGADSFHVHDKRGKRVLGKTPIVEDSSERREYRLYDTGRKAYTGKVYTLDDAHSIAHENNKKNWANELEVRDRYGNAVDGRGQLF